MLRSFSSRERGLFVSVDGPSGVGKSTIVHHLARMLVAIGGILVRTVSPAPNERDRAGQTGESPMTSW